MTSLHRSLGSAWPASVRSVVRNPFGRSAIAKTETVASGTPRPSRLEDPALDRDIVATEADRDRLRRGLAVDLDPCGPEPGGQGGEVT